MTAKTEPAGDVHNVYFGLKAQVNWIYIQVSTKIASLRENL